MSNIANLLYKLQPSFIKLRQVDSFPECVRGKYMICLPFPNMQDTFGEITTKTVAGIPCIYICLESIVEEEQYDTFLNFILVVQADPLQIFEGTENFVPGEDYFISESFYKKFYSTGDFPSVELNLMPDYCRFGNDVVFNQFYYNTLLFDSNAKDFNNIKYFYKLNLQKDQVFSEEELNAFCATFCKLILKYSDYCPCTKTDIIYHKVLKFFAKNQLDDIIENLNLIVGVNTQISSTTQQKSSCSCQSMSYNYLGQSQTNSFENCVSIYRNAMIQYLTQMLADPNFYKTFFFLHYDINGNKIYPTLLATNNGNGKDDDGGAIISTDNYAEISDLRIISGCENEEYVTDVNELLINSLITLIHEFLEAGYNLNFTKNITATLSCPSVNTDNSQNDSNKQIILNYENVLNWVKTEQIEPNKNKIKIYGQQFAQLLPNLNF